MGQFDGATWRRMLRAALVLTLVLAACGPAKSPALEWQPGVRLTWDDFMAPVPEHRRHDAETATGITASSWACEGGRMVVVGARAYFNRTASFALPAKADADLLNHEQGHFTLTELSARELRERMRAIPCANREPAAIQAVVDEILRDVNQGFLVESERYDRETDHGRDRAGQQRWDQQLRQRMEQTAGR